LSAIFSITHHCCRFFIKVHSALFIPAHLRFIEADITRFDKRIHNAASLARRVDSCNYGGKENGAIGYTGGYSSCRRAGRNNSDEYRRKSSTYRHAHTFDSTANCHPAVKVTKADINSGISQSGLAFESHTLVSADEFLYRRIHL